MLVSDRLRIANRRPDPDWINRLDRDTTFDVRNAVDYPLAIASGFVP